MPARLNLDFASGTPLLPEVKQAVAAALEESGNPSAVHRSGQIAKERLELARRQVAGLIGAKPGEIYFTSSGTESNNWALRGLLAGNKRKGSHLIISSIEHPSISLVARRLELDHGVTVSVLPVDRDGLVSPAALKAELRPDTALVSVMLANGEVGTIEPVRELAAVAHEQGALFHTDAVAAAGHAPIDVKALGVDALSLSSNQFYGPPGAAALFVRDGVRILPLMEGGGQETGARSGTENVPAITGMGVAAELATARCLTPVQSGAVTDTGCGKLARLRDRLRDGLRERIEHIRFNGSWSARLPHNVHVCFDGVSSEALVLGLDSAGVAAGLGSACNSKAMRPSHVLKAMGLSEDEARGALVLTVGEMTTEADVDEALSRMPAVIQRLRSVTAMTSRLSK